MLLAICKTNLKDDLFELRQLSYLIKFNLYIQYNLSIILCDTYFCNTTINEIMNKLDASGTILLQQFS